MITKLINHKLNSIEGAAFNKVLLPNECVEATQFLTSKDLKQWSVEACHAINLVQTFKLEFL